MNNQIPETYELIEQRELKQQIVAKNEELARKEALKKELESQILLEKAEAERLASHCMKAAK